MIWVTAERINAKPNESQIANKQGNHLSLCVSDNGRGLPVQDRQRICEPFFSTKETGLGLGLAISQRLIDAHDGELLALDREGGGAIFKIILPARFGIECEITDSPPRSEPIFRKEN
jgi:signal transduction histidine kinase